MTAMIEKRPCHQSKDVPIIVEMMKVGRKGEFQERLVPRLVF